VSEINTTDERFVELALKAMASLHAEHRKAAVKAHGAMLVLVAAMRERTGQAYKLREILFSLWNGKPCRLNETLGLDWDLKQAVCHVLMGWGYEDEHVKFFYNAMRASIATGGLWDWFLEEAQQLQVMRSYVEAAL
jgi:hypothetical protein